MVNPFFTADDSPPSTPTRQGRRTASSFVADPSSTTPAGNPRPSDLSFASDSPSYGLGSKSTGYKVQPPSRTGKKMFSQIGSHSGLPSTPLGRSLRDKRLQPSGLSHVVNVDRGTDQEDEDAEGEDEPPRPHGDLFIQSTPPASKISSSGDVAHMDEEMVMEALDKDIDAEAVSEEGNNSDVADLFLNMKSDDRTYDQLPIDQEVDLMLMNNPAANEKISREAESIFKQSSARLGRTTARRAFQFASIARGMYSNGHPTQTVESPALILATEDLVCRLYDEGVGVEDDAEKMDNSLAGVAFRLTQLWNDYASSLPKPEGEDFTVFGLGAKALPFAKAAYVAHLVLRMHHTRLDDEYEGEKTVPLPEIMFDWLRSSYNLLPDRVRSLYRDSPSPASHPIYWETLRSLLLRGDLPEAVQLLKNAGWENVLNPGGDKAYTAKALEHIRLFTDAACETLTQCPAMRSDWDIWSSDWTLFRVRARAALDKLTIFAEGRGSRLNDFSAEPTSASLSSISSMARMASSQLPWEIYENLQLVYDIILGKPEPIIETAQDWCEATIGLLGWWDDGSQQPSPVSYSMDYFDRLAAAFHLVCDFGLIPSAVEPLDVAMASAFEGNMNAVIGILRVLSLPIGCSVAEIASLGGWLSPGASAKLQSSDDLDKEDFAVLGSVLPTNDEVDGIKDSTLALYARALAAIDRLSPDRYGWEMAMQVLGRMDSPDKSEQLVGELLQGLFKSVKENSRPMVDKMWRNLNDMGMAEYAEQTAAHFADVLSSKTRRYGEALWYFALAHRTDKVREVLNLLMAYSLLHSTAYPPSKDLDQDLDDLLRKRTETLEARARQDLEAAQLLGRMLSGYATLRKFYELRDRIKSEELSAPGSVALRKQASMALATVISSADDNIRGGLYDESRDAVVSEDFMLALLGEATVFVDQSPAVITLDQIDILLKAIEDVETVGPLVLTPCEDFFNLVLCSAQGLRGSKPTDLMEKSTMSRGGSSYVMSGSSLLASHMRKSMPTGTKVARGWDWRKGWLANSKSSDVLRKLRLGLARDLAVLWLEDADEVSLY